MECFARVSESRRRATSRPRCPPPPYNLKVSAYGVAAQPSPRLSWRLPRGAPRSPARLPSPPRILRAARTLLWQTEARGGAAHPPRPPRACAAPARGLQRDLRQLLAPADGCCAARLAAAACRHSPFRTARTHVFPARTHGNPAPAPFLPRPTPARSRMSTGDYRVADICECAAGGCAQRVAAGVAPAPLGQRRPRSSLRSPSRTPSRPSHTPPHSPFPSPARSLSVPPSLQPWRTLAARRSSWRRLRCPA